MSSKNYSDDSSFKINGILYLPGFLADKVKRLEADFKNIVPLSTLGESRPFIANSALHSQTFKEVLKEKRVRDKLLLLPRIIDSPVAGDITRYCGKTMWHRDMTSGTLKWLKLIVYVSLPKEQNFIFKFLPESHDIDRYKLDSKSQINNISELSISSGDVIVFSPYLLHAVDEEVERHQFSALFSEIPETCQHKKEFGSIALSNTSIL